MKTCGGVEEKVLVVAPHKFFFFFLGLEVGRLSFFFFFFLSAENWPVKCMGDLVGWLDQLHLRVRGCDGQTGISTISSSMMFPCPDEPRL